MATFRVINTDFSSDTVVTITEEVPDIDMAIDCVIVCIEKSFRDVMESRMCESIADDYFDAVMQDIEDFIDSEMDKCHEAEYYSSSMPGVTGQIILNITPAAIVDAIDKFAMSSGRLPAKVKQAVKALRKRFIIAEFN